jgi:hypothetical protein
MAEEKKEMYKYENISTSESIDIEKIMNEIREDIAHRKMDGTLIPFEEVPLSRKEVSVKLNQNYDIEEVLNYLNLANNTWRVTSDRSLAGSKLVILLKRIIRKSIRYYVKPAIEDQNSYNAVIANLLIQFKAYIDVNEEQKMKQKIQLEEQQAKIMEIQKQLVELK